MRPETVGWAGLNDFALGYDLFTYRSELVMHISWSRCPHCGKTIELEMKPGGPWKLKLGPMGAFSCPKCRSPISNGMLEWSDMDWAEKLNELALFFMRCFIVAPILGMLIVGAAGMGVGYVIGENGKDWLSGWGLSGAVFFFVWNIRASFREIQESKQRSRKHQ